MHESGHNSPPQHESASHVIQLSEQGEGKQRGWEEFVCDLRYLHYRGYLVQANVKVCKNLIRVNRNIELKNEVKRFQLTCLGITACCERDGDTSCPLAMLSYLQS